MAVMSNEHHNLVERPHFPSIDYFIALQSQMDEIHDHQDGTNLALIDFTAQDAGVIVPPLFMEA